VLGECWAAVGGDAAALAGLEVTDPDRWLGGPLDTDGLAVGTAGAALLAAAELAEARGLGRPAAAVSAEHLALSFTSERHVRLAGAPAGGGFAALSRMLRCAGGGWARTHGNYRHHAAALCRALAIEPSVDALEAAARSVTAEELEAAVVAAGGCAAALRSAEAWVAEGPGAAVARTPLVEWVSGAPPGSVVPRGEFGLVRSQAEQLRTRRAADAARPAAGLRVLDLTRVIAGPVAGRTLGALGADVLRVDSPGLPEMREAHLDTGPGKRSALLDLADEPAREALLARADVLLLGYRPGALDRFGLGPEALAARHPHLVTVSLSAWGHAGPWAGRRGFDSLVQVATGIAAACAAPDGTPGVLPAQALDHGTGHLMAAAALRALAARVRGEPARSARLSLARTAAALLAAPRPERERTAPTGAADHGRHRARFGDLELIAPPGSLDSVPLAWAHGPHALGADPPAWPA